MGAASAMPGRKKKQPRGGAKPHGHYCRVCSEHKANEKFSGKGHASHICKACAAMTADQRSEQLTLRKIEGMAFRYLSGQEIQWLRGKMTDRRVAVAEAARETHGMKFPRYERNQMKKGLTAVSLELFLHGEVWDDYGDALFVHALVTLDDMGLLRHTDHSAPEEKRSAEVTVNRQDARRFLKSVIHELDALFWDVDLSDAGPGADDPYLDIQPDGRPELYDMADMDDGAAEPPVEMGGPDRGCHPGAGRLPLWSLRLELNNGEEKAVTFYDELHDEPRELYLSLVEWMEREASGDA